MRSPDRKLFPKLFSLCLVVWLAACAGTPPAPKQRVFWPVPPEQPRVEWLGTYASEDDFPKTNVQRHMEAITGKPPVMRFKYPFGIAADGKGRVYIADSTARTVVIYDLNALKVETLDQGVVGFPAGMTMDADGNLYVADLDRRVVTVLGPDRKAKAVIGASGDLKSPTYVAVDDARDRLYVSDSRENKVYVYNRAGTRLRVIGPELGNGEFLYNPQGLAVDRDGNIFVAQTTLARIAVLSPEGQLLRTFGERGDQVYQFESPKALAFDSEDNLWVTDARRNYIYTYNKEGRVLLATGGVSLSGDSPLGIQAAVGLYIDPNDTIYVSDRLLKRFSVWQYLNARYLAEHPLSTEELKQAEQLRIEAEKNLKK